MAYFGCTQRPLASSDMASDGEKMVEMETARRLLPFLLCPD